MFRHTILPNCLPPTLLLLIPDCFLIRYCVFTFLFYGQHNFFVCWMRESEKYSIAIPPTKFILQLDLNSCKHDLILQICFLIENLSFLTNLSGAQTFCLRCRLDRRNCMNENHILVRECKYNISLK